ncbi:Bacteriocin-protection, YdeI or OmpD-Associated [Mucilaginibacter mallensis]|uniref:Bacteriocin-protection, YdeI or OmpD-Associated n=1 Tax=Mucilaginibacter mallensis TaxID=652787 RepID=A0A1H1YG55_MUCMA|nr:YdeI/OmpD-associated family protein [Mucilaginibacter mallensis]SDT20450.1 Bacteriocin-protection, YdeI or OmpD-Associated [Mucilaginibacter mallensis]
MNLPQKLQIKSGKHWLFFNAPGNYLTVIEPLPDNVTVSYEPTGEFDGIQLFIKNAAELTSSLTILKPILKPDTVFWVTYPKKSSGMDSGLEMMGSWDELTNLGLRIVTSVSVNETWTALRFKPVELTKLSDSRNANIAKNEYGDYIDIENRQITLPADMAEILQDKPQAMAFYQQLSYSNKKEYVVWILSAKQEKTREERLVKMVDKLLGDKKNPAEK